MKMTWFLFISAVVCFAFSVMMEPEAGISVSATAECPATQVC